MPDTTAHLDLLVPQAAIEAFLDANPSAPDRSVRAITAPVVAAELRRIADIASAHGMAHSGVLGPGISSATRMLRARADELDPPARQED